LGLEKKVLNNTVRSFQLHPKGTMGVIPLSVQTIANMVIEVCAMLPAGLGMAISIRIGSTLPTNVHRAQCLSIWSVIIGTIVFILLSLLLYKARSLVVAVFTDDDDVAEGCEEIWWKVSFLHFNVGVYGIVMGIATGLGMQWTLGIASFVVLVLMGLPASYYYAIVREGGLDMIWVWINPPYMLISILLLFSFLRTDWRAIAAEIIEREGSETDTEGSDSMKSADPENGGYGATASQKPLVNSPA
jgi:Na+-driven multidrug efflux pump